MKMNLWTSLLPSHWGVAAVIIGLCAFTPASRGDVIVDNTGDASAGSDSAINAQMLGQLFTMPASGSVDISSLTLTLAGSGSSEVYVYNTSGGTPTTQLYDLGSVSSSTPTITIGTPANDPLSASTTYAIVLGVSSSSLAWSFTSTTASGGTGTLGHAFWFATGTWSDVGSNPYQMNFQTTAVPEVPVTGVVMGLGALAIAAGRTLRRSLRPDISRIA